MTDEVHDEAAPRGRRALAAAAVVLALAFLAVAVAVGNGDPLPDAVPRGEPVDLGRIEVRVKRAQVVKGEPYGYERDDRWVVVRLRARNTDTESLETGTIDLVRLRLPEGGSLGIADREWLVRDAGGSAQLHPGVPEVIELGWKLPRRVTSPNRAVLVLHEEVRQRRNPFLVYDTWFRSREPIASMRVRVADGGDAPEPAL